MGAGSPNRFYLRGNRVPMGAGSPSQPWAPAQRLHLEADATGVEALGAHLRPGPVSPVGHGDDRGIPPTQVQVLLLPLPCGACEPHEQQQDLSPQHGCSTCSQLTGPFIPSRAGRRDLAASQLPSQGAQACQMARISCRRGLIPLPGGVQGADPPALCLGPSPDSLPGATGHHVASRGSGWCGARALSSPPPGSHRVQDGICALPFALSFFFAVKMNGHVHRHL